MASVFAPIVNRRGRATRNIHYAQQFRFDRSPAEEIALEKLDEDAALLHPVHLRDMIVRADLAPEPTLALNRKLRYRCAALERT